MSQLLINDYLNEIERLRKFAGTSTETVVRQAFQNLLSAWSKSENLVFIPELSLDTNLKTRVIPDGTILHDVRVPLGYWEAKDTSDDLDTEIAAKFRKGYPQDNIIFENSDIAVLIQDRNEVLRCGMTDTDALAQLLTLFFAYERPEIAQFRAAVRQFQDDLPAVLQALRDKIDAAYTDNDAFKTIAEAFLGHARETINPTLGEADVREMLIQHILTEEIFARVFEEADFHRDNNVARLLYKLESAFFTGEVKKSTLRALQPYYTAINANAAQITSHAEKQNFLKLIYENFYKVYNPDAADRLGVVYTPNEIVRFMIEGADWLCKEHFDKCLIDPGVDILDPATGTGTYICELIQHFSGQPDKLRHKYTQELHANEVAILPYYVANLNIEATYQSVSGQYAEYPNLCFVDTLDNIGGLGIKSGHQFDMFAAVSDENVKRVREQNKRKISVVIGNPPYNAQQGSVGAENKNREYPHIDKLIKNSITKYSSATKGRNQDPFIRFYRWASDRLHDDGIVAFITNRSFIDGGSHDGLRRFFRLNFSDIYVIDLGGAWRRTDHAGGENVFEGIGTGVAIAFLVKRGDDEASFINICNLGEIKLKEEKLRLLSSSSFQSLDYKRIVPDERDSWADAPPNDWSGFLSVIDDRTKNVGRKSFDRSIFRNFGLGVSTNRDKWVYSISKEELEYAKIFLTESYNAGPKGSESQRKISWSDTLKTRRKRNPRLGDHKYTSVLARPYVKKTLLSNPLLIDRPGVSKVAFPTDAENTLISINDLNSRADFCVVSANSPMDLHIGDTKDGYQCLPLHRYTPDGERLDNITDWALNKFTKHYGKAAKISKDDIFAYVYGVLHDPIYRDTYAINLKREFPRIPFYSDFAQWRDWGQRLLDLHIGYEDISPWPLTRLDVTDKKSAAAGLSPVVRLRADKEAGIITLDSETTLSGVPAACWDYMLGNRSGLEWVLDQYKEKTPKDPTIRAKFNTYRFAAYKEHVIDLLGRVTRVSVETIEVVDAMRALPRETAE
jgi:predicted helicase